MEVLEVFDPSGLTEVTELHAPRLETLEGKAISLKSASAQALLLWGGNR